MVDLTVELSDVKFENPILASPGPPTDNLRRVRKCVKYGVGGIVFKTAVSDSLKVMRRWPRPRFKLLRWKPVKASSVPDCFVLYSIEQAYRGDIEAYCKELRMVKDSVEVPVGGSIACTSIDEWISIARKVEETGIDFLEVDISCPHEPEQEKKTFSKMVYEVTRELSRNLSIPIVPKLTFQVEDLVEVAKEADRSGASWITVANRLLGIDIDVENAKPIMHGSYAGIGGPWSIYYGLRWISEITSEVAIPVSASGGVMNSEDIIKYLMVGAKSVQICTVIIVKGYKVIDELLLGLKKFLEANSYSTVSEIVGKALPNIIPIGEVEREPPVTAEVDSSLCKGCGVCLLKCQYEAISMVNGKAIIDKDKCDGCGLCVELCPFKAIRMVKLPDNVGREAPHMTKQG